MDSKSVLVTGGTGTVGQAIVRTLSGAGYTVTFTYCNDRITAETLALETGASFLHLDLNEPQFTELPSGIYALVNCAAINPTGAPCEMVSDHDWNRTLSVNLSGVFLLCRHFICGMKETRSGRIVNIGSIFGITSVEGNLPYNVSKFALQGLTRSLARELGAFEITCNSIAPGPIDSELLRNIALRDEPGVPSEQYFAARASEVPTGRLISATNVAGTVLFLLSEIAKDINGTTIIIDGGILA